MSKSLLVRDVPVVFLTWSEPIRAVKSYTKGAKEYIGVTDYGVPAFTNVANIEVAP